MKKKTLLLIASGNGTGANAIMEAWKQGAIPGIGKIVLMSTKANAGCLTKATENGVESFTLVPPTSPLALGDQVVFRDLVWAKCKQFDIGCIFLVGCTVIMPLIGNIPMYNIHPACPILHGGQTMHGLKVHEHVLRFHLDAIERGKVQLFASRFFTLPTVHEVTEKPDDGVILLQGCVEIPSRLLSDIQSGRISLAGGAKQLQDLVLPNEWMILPAAVEMAIARIET